MIFILYSVVYIWLFVNNKNKPTTAINAITVEYYFYYFIDQWI